MKKIELKENVEIRKLKNGAGEFKKFISKGNVVDMAVGVIIGGAFGKIVTSLVNDVLMPVIGVLLGGLDFSELTIEVGKATIMYGSFIQTIVDFLIISFSIFIMIKLIERVKRREVEEETVSKSDDILLLEEIRDLLKKNGKEGK